MHFILIAALPLLPFAGAIINKDIKS